MTARTRSKPIVSESATTYNEQRRKETNVLLSSHTKPYYPLYQTEVMNDVVIDNFHSRKKAGDIFFNPMTRTKTVKTIIPTYVQGYSTVSQGSTTDTGTYELIGDLGIPFKGAPASRADDLIAKRNLASTAALSKASSEEVMILATIGEAKETKEMLIGAVKHLMRLRPLLRSYGELLRLGNKSKRRYAFKLYKEAESVWMQIRMGWRPFYYECQSLYEAIASKKVYPQRQTFRGGVADLTYNASDTYGSGHVFKRTYTEQTRIRAGSLHQQRKYGFPDTFGLTKIPGAIWELTKLSWAVDYFFNVGKAIAAYTPDTLWECLGGWVTYRSTIVQTIELVSVSVSGWKYPSVKGGMQVKTTNVVQRVPGTFIGVHFSPKMNSAKYLDILAVSRQQLTKVISFCMDERYKKKT